VQRVSSWTLGGPSLSLLQSNAGCWSAGVTAGGSCGGCDGWAADSRGCDGGVDGRTAQAR